MANRLGTLPQNLVVTLLLAYWLTLGGLWQGIYHPGIFAVTRTLLALALIAWAIWRTAARWRWHKTPLDPALPLWGIAFALSTLANLGQMESIAFGLWWMAVYVAVYYVLSDIVANNGLSRERLLEALLVAGLLPVLRGLWEVCFTGGRIQAGLENANTAGAVFVILFLLSLRRRWWGYALAVVLCLVATGSRGAWISAGVGLTVAVLPRLRASTVEKGIALLPAVALAGALYLVRADTGRLVYWGDALGRFAERPLTGEGLFTYRHVDFVDPANIHTHAHNAVLNIAAELGIPGLLALAVTAVLVVRSALRQRDPWLLGLLAAVAVHNLVDFPAQAPVVMLSLLVVLAALSPRPGNTASADLPRAGPCAAVAAR